MKRALHLPLFAVLVLGVACHGNEIAPPEPEPELRHRLVVTGGNDQTDTVGRRLAVPLSVQLLDSTAQPIPNAVVAWRVVSGDGELDATTTTGPDGTSTAAYTLGALAGIQSVAVRAEELGGAPVYFTLHASNDLPTVLAKRNGDRLFGDVNTSLAPALQVRLGDRFGNPVAWQTIAWTALDGGTLAAATSVTDAGGVASMTRMLGDGLGVHRTVAELAGSPDVRAEFVATAVAPVMLATVIQLDQNQYGAHDSYIRNGIAFLAAWDQGLLIYDVGNGMRGGSPTAPVEISRMKTVGTAFPGFPAVHNAWWMWNPVNGERRYVFVGEEGQLSPPDLSEGDVHVVDVSDLTAPREVASYDLPGAGAHYFYLDEPNQVLYVAFYSGGVVALDVSGTLEGDLADREIGRIAPGGPGQTFVYGAQLVNGSVYASDMLSGVWQLRLGPSGLVVEGGGFNVPTDGQRQGSEIAAGNGYLYSGTRIGVGGRSPVLIWELAPSGAPVLVDSLYPSPAISAILDVKTTPDRRLLMVSAAGPESALYFYDLADPRRPTLAGRYSVPDPSVSFHSANFFEVGGKLYAMVAQDPPEMKFLVLDLSAIGERL